MMCTLCWECRKIQPVKLVVVFLRSCNPPICSLALMLYPILSVLPVTLLTLNCLEALQACLVYTLLLRTACQTGPRGVPHRVIPLLGLTLRPEPSTHTSMSSRRASSGPRCAAQAQCFHRCVGPRPRGPSSPPMVQPTPWHGGMEPRRLWLADAAPAGQQHYLEAG